MSLKRTRAGGLFLRLSLIGILAVFFSISNYSISLQHAAHAEESGGGADGGSDGGGDGQGGGDHNESGGGGGGGGGGAECLGCEPKDVQGAVKVIEQFHKWGEEDITRHTSQEFNKHRDTFLYQEFFHKNFLPALMRMTKQLSAVAMKQMFAVGTFFDAKNQLETQRLFQTMQAQAHKDYHPSEDFCYFGTNVRSMAHSESLGRFNALAMSQRAMARHLGRSGVVAADADKDKGSRWKQFIATYCDPKDNNWTEAGTGLSQVCTAPGNASKRNLDVDYTRLIEEARTLNVNFTKEDLAISEMGGDEQDVIALANNLYGHKVLYRAPAAYLGEGGDNQKKYMALRAVAAKRSVAENSYNAIIGLKSSGSSGSDASSAAQTRRFLGAVLIELGMGEDEVKEVLGENPSYYAQLEILAKKIYQNPDFYANLYDKPVNLQRKSVAIKAIEMLVDDAIAESIMRQEMLDAVSLSTRLEERFDNANEGLNK